MRRYHPHQSVTTDKTRHSHGSSPVPKTNNELSLDIKKGIPRNTEGVKWNIGEWVSCLPKEASLGRSAFQYAKNSGKFGRNSYGKVCFGSFWPEYSVVQFDRSDRNLPFHCDKSVQSCREFRKGIKMVKAIPVGWPGLNGKCRSIFSWLVLLVSDRSGWHNGKHPEILTCA